MKIAEFLSIVGGRRSSVEELKAQLEKIQAEVAAKEAELVDIDTHLVGEGKPDNALKLDFVPSNMKYKYDKESNWVTDETGHIICQCWGKDEESFANSKTNGPKIAAALNALELVTEGPPGCTVMDSCKHRGSICSCCRRSWTDRYFA